MFASLLKLFGCGSSSDSTKQSDNDTLAADILKSVEDFQNRPVYETLTSEIIDTISDENLEQAIIDNLWTKMRKDLADEYEKVSTFSKSRQAIFVTWRLEAEVNNGGFNQYYYNSSGQYADKTEEALKLLGANKFADLVKRANTVYKNENAKITKHLDGSMEGFSKSYDDNPLNTFDSEFYDLYKIEDLFKIKVAYIRGHKSEFVDK